MQSLECVELPLFVLLPKMSVPDIKNLFFFSHVVYIIISFLYVNQFILNQLLLLRTI